MSNPETVTSGGIKKSIVRALDEGFRQTRITGPHTLKIVEPGSSTQDSREVKPVIYGRGRAFTESKIVLAAYYGFENRRSEDLLYQIFEYDKPGKNTLWLPGQIVVPPADAFIRVPEIVETDGTDLSRAMEEIEWGIPKFKDPTPLLARADEILQRAGVITADFAA